MQVLAIYLLDAALLLATLLLSPLLMLQALYLRKMVPRLPEPITQEEGAAGAGQELRLVLLGDSAGAGVGATDLPSSLLGQLLTGLEQQFRVNWRLLARTGATTAATLQRLEKLEVQEFEVAVTSLGVNDITGLVPLPVWLRRQRRLVRLLSEKFGVQRIYLATMPPMHSFPALPQPLRWCLGQRARNFSRALRSQLAFLPGCHLVELDLPFEPTMMAHDGFHPGPPIYAIWGNAVAEQLLRDFSEIKDR